MTLSPSAYLPMRVAVGSTEDSFSFINPLGEILPNSSNILAEGSNALR